MTTLKRIFSWPDTRKPREHDNRPIGALHVCEPTHASATNPAGWLFDLYPGTTLAEQAHAYAVQAIAIMLDMGAQGGVFWDWEGGRNPPTDPALAGLRFYAGSPEIISVLNPEITPAFLKTFLGYFTAAGLQTGGLVRAAEYNLKTNLLEDSPDPMLTLFRKIDYAHRLGFRIIYVDSNFTKADGSGQLLPAEMFKWIGAQFPDCLIVPEAEDDRYYEVAAPYKASENGDTGTPAAIRAQIPNAFSVINVNSDKADANLDAIIANVKAGDIVLCNGWADSSAVTRVKKIMRAAAV